MNQTKTYRFEDNEFNITVPKDPDDPGRLLYSPKFRKYPNENQIIIRVSTNEFFDDIDYLFKNYLEYDVRDDYTNAFEFSLDSICERNIKDYGRLIDVDLEFYLDKTMELFYAIFELELYPLSFREGKAIRDQYFENAKQMYYEHIYVNYSGPFNFTLVSPRLIKLSELHK